MKIWAHTIVKNEERYIWFSVMSVIDYVDKILIWDTGSTDATVKIINEIRKTKHGKRKVIFREIGEVDINEFTKVRQQMLDQTKGDWLIIVDGDEVWWNTAIAELTSAIRKSGNKLESIVNRYYNVIGDIYHYQEESAGRYEIDGRRGHLTIRAMNRKIPGLTVTKPHGQQGFFDGSGTSIQERTARKRVHIDTPAFLHFTHLPRSSSFDFDARVPKRKMKLKYELGKSFALDFYYPEVFFKPRPSIVPNPWERTNSLFFLQSAISTAPRRIKRRVIKGSTGY